MPSSTPVANYSSSVATGEGPRQRSGAAIWIWAIVALGAVLRLIALGHKSFWLDEIASVEITLLPAAAFWRMLWHAESNMALYYILLRPWLHFGVTEASVRLLSAVAGIACVPLMYVLGKRLFGPTTARLAALFFALNACAIWVAQEARGYSLLLLFVIVSTYLLVRLVERPTLAMACAYGVVTGLTLYCHYFGLFVPAAQAISLMALAPRRWKWKPFTIAAAIIVLAALPVLWMIHLADIGHITWVERTSLLEVYHLGVYLAAGGGKALGAMLLLLDLVLLALFLWALKGLWRDGDDDLRRWRYVLVASGFLAPLIIVLLISIVQPIFYHRFLIIGLPAWVLMTSAGAEQIRPRAWRTVAIAGVCGLSLVCVVTSYSRVQEDWRGVTRYLIAQARPDDRVLYYQREGYFAVENYRNWLPGGNAPRPPGVTVGPGSSDWEKQLDSAQRVWQVLYRAKPDDPVAQSIEATLGQRYKLEQQVAFRAVTVTEYVVRR